MAQANAAFVCEYSRDSEISRGRSRFVHGQTDILLYSGRAHFFRRLMMRGALNIVFYSLPEYPNFYSEFVNMLESSEQIAEVVATRKMKMITKTSTDESIITNKYAASNAASKKSNKKRQRLEEQAEMQAKQKQSRYSPEELQKLPNSCVVLFSPFEKMLLEGIVGKKRCEHMTSSGKMTFMFK